jgi:hypothetical protein
MICQHCGKPCAPPPNLTRGFACSVCGFVQRAPQVTPSDALALEHALAGLRELDRAELERVSTELTMNAAAMCQGGNARDKMPDRAAALLMLARVAYVVAHEGQRG